MNVKEDIALKFHLMLILMHLLCDSLHIVKTMLISLLLFGEDVE